MDEYEKLSEAIKLVRENEDKLLMTMKLMNHLGELRRLGLEITRIYVSTETMNTLEKEGRRSKLTPYMCCGVEVLPARH